MTSDEALARCREVEATLASRGIVLPALQNLIEALEVYRATPDSRKTEEDKERLYWLMRVARREVAKKRRELTSGSA